MNIIKNLSIFILLFAFAFSEDQKASEDSKTPHLRLGRYAFHIDGLETKASPEKLLPLDAAKQAPLDINAEKRLILSNGFSDKTDGLFIIKNVEGIYVLYNEFNGKWFVLKNAFLEEMGKLKEEYKSTASELERLRNLSHSFEKQSEIEALTKKMKAMSDEILAFDQSQKGADHWSFSIAFPGKDGKLSHHSLFFDSKVYQIGFEEETPKSNKPSPINNRAPMIFFYYLIVSEHSGKFYDKKDFILYNLGLNPKGTSVIVFLLNLDGEFQILLYDYLPRSRRNFNTYLFGKDNKNHFVLNEDKNKKTMTFQFYDKNKFLLMEASQDLLMLPKANDLSSVKEMPQKTPSNATQTLDKNQKKK